MQKHCIIQLFKGVKSYKRPLKKISLAMRLFFIFLICSFSLANASDGFAQKTSISLALNNCTVEEALRAIELESGYGFFINNKNINLKRKVTISTSSPRSINRILDEMFENTNIIYKIIDNKIVLTAKDSESVQQQKGGIVSGIVKDQNGSPLIGVTVIEKSTTNGAITGIDGDYKIVTTTPNPVLVFSYIGYQTQEVNVKNKIVADVVLQDETQALSEVVVTALGIKREQKALSYNVQEMKADELTTVKDANFMSSLSGKVAGVNINMSSAGAGGASRVVMRGVKSLGDNNNALYVIDGVPIYNSNNGAIKGGAMSLQPRGEGISDINPEDIEKVTVLSGPSAAALYGSDAAAGVILITTKKGKEGKVKITVTNNTSFSSPFIMPKFQNTYGNRPGEFMSWGEKGTGLPYEPADFFNTGTDIQNTISLSTGTEKNQTYLSAGTANSRGIIPNNKYNRYNFTFRNTTSFLNDKMTLDVGAQYVIQEDQNMMAQGQYYNPLPALYLYPRGENMDDMRMYEEFDEIRGIPSQRWKWKEQGMDMQNPYWIVNRNLYGTKKDRYMFNAGLKYDILEWLNVAGRIRVDNANSDYERKNYATTNELFAGPKGFYSLQKIQDKQVYGDLIVTINKRFNDFSLFTNVGGSFVDKRNTTSGAQGSLRDIPNKFVYQNIDMVNGRASYLDQDGWRQFTASAFASVELGWKSMLYLTLTGRNDWDSALANTEQLSFFYPSVGLSAVITEMVKLPEFINYLKVRGSYASVGSAIPRGLSMTGYTYNKATGMWDAPLFRPLGKLYPERTNSFEFGFTSKFFKNSLSIDFTYYKSNTKNQTMSVPISESSGFSTMYVQSGNVQNKGVELTVGYHKDINDFSWSSSLTFSKNKNKIIELLDNYQDPLSGEIYNVPYIDKGGIGANVRLVPGGSMGDIYVDKVLKRDNEGYVYIDPVTQNVVLESIATNPKKVGSVLPKCNLGFRNELSYKNINLSFLITARIGGVVVSSTEAMMDYYGVSEKTAKLRDKGNGKIKINKGEIDVEKYYSKVGGPDGLMSNYVYDATNVRLQEVSLGYTFPKKWMNSTVLSVALTGRNLWMIYNKAPFDPEMTASTGTFNQGCDFFMQPSLRNIGFRVKLSF